MKKQDLKNYKPKGGLEGFPKEIISRMLDCQKEQGNPRDVSVFEKQFDAEQCDKGFDWYDTKEGWEFWCKVIRERDFNLFFEKYPKKDNPQDFRVDDLENYIPKGDIECYPKEIISRMLECQVEQGNPRDVTVFERNVYSALDQGGFDWDTSIENGIFWSEVISANNFNLFFKKYPKKDNQDNSQDFRVDDLENYIPKGQLEGFPKEIISRMLDCQEEQGNPRDVSVFEKRCDVGQNDKGFTWGFTKEGIFFWDNVINNKDFDFFFERYPKKDNPQDFRVDDLENYTPKGQLEGFPKEIIAKMLDHQEEQGNPRDVSVFEKQVTAVRDDKGFSWGFTKEGDIFWYNVINNKYFGLFFEKYPKQYSQDYSQEFKVGDDVIDIITGQRGKVLQINDNRAYPIYVSYEKESYTLDGKYYADDKYPRLLHYRDDYDYSVIDFNNPPKRQETKRWRAKKEGVYYFINFFTKDWFFSDETKDVYDSIDNSNYNSGNYFRTEIEAETIAQKLNEYFKQLIKEEHERN